MKDDFLNKLANEAGDQLNNNDQSSPFARQKEPSKPIQVRQSYYQEIKKIAFFQDKKMIDVIDDMLNFAISSGKFDQKEK